MLFPAVTRSPFQLRLPWVLLALISEEALADRTIGIHSAHEESSSPSPFTIPTSLAQKVRAILFQSGGRPCRRSRWAWESEI